MKHVFKVGDAVFARVAGFEPFPATVESVLLNESDSSVFYYVQFHGGPETVPIDANNLLSFAKNKKLFKFKYTENDLKKEAKLRVDALLGAEDDIPEVLMNFVTVDSDFEEVSNETVKRLGLYSITLNSHVVKTLDSRLSMKHSKPLGAKSESENEFVDVEEVPHVANGGKNHPQTRYPCSNCLLTWSSKRSLVAHRRQSKCGATQARKDKREINDDQRNHTMRTMWASRSASGYFNCKLCYRKFRSKGEAQAHMSNKHRGVMKNIQITVEDNIDDSSSDSDSISQSRSATKHSSMERERRKALASCFGKLAETLYLEKGSSKVNILQMAKQQIAMLEKESTRCQQLLEQLKSLNVSLKMRDAELKAS